MLKNKSKQYSPYMRNRLGLQAIIPTNKHKGGRPRKNPISNHHFDRLQKKNAILYKLCSGITCTQNGVLKSILKPHTDFYHDGKDLYCKQCVSYINSQNWASRCIQNAKLRVGYEHVTLTVDILKKMTMRQEGKCYWCNIYLVLTPNSSCTPSLDRLDSNIKQYSIHTCVVTCQFCQYLGGSLDKKTIFIDYIQAYWKQYYICNNAVNTTTHQNLIHLWDIQDTDLLFHIHRLQKYTKHEARLIGDLEGGAKISKRDIFDILYFQNGACAATKIPFDWSIRSSSSSIDKLKMPSMDRRVPHVLKMTFPHVQIVQWGYNQMKNRFPDDLAREHVSRLCNLSHMETKVAESHRLYVNMDKQ